MRAYSLVFDKLDGRPAVHFVGSEAEARQFRMNLMKEGLKRNEIEINMVEIPTGKADLLKWINAEVKR